MKAVEHARGAPDPSLRAERTGLVERVAASSYFERSARLREFLLYICDRALSGRLAEINEQQIGWKVFGRPPDYNSNEDNIVRVEARELRKRLASYFENEGADEPIVITIPKGGYVPVFKPRVSDVDVSLEPSKKWTSRLWVFSSSAAIILAIACVYLWVENQGWKQAATSSEYAKQHPLWSRLFDDQHYTLIVAADSSLALIRDITGHEVSLADYINRRYLGPAASDRRNRELEPIVGLISTRQHTSLADISVASRILQLIRPNLERTSVRYARNLEIRDFRDNNAILLGSSRSNPWVELFLPTLNFHAGFSEKSQKAYFRNISPQPGEAPIYPGGGHDGRSDESYGVIAFLPNLNSSGNVLILAGTDMKGTEAAGEFATGPVLSSKLVETAGLDPDGRLRYFEVLIRLRTIGGSFRDPEIVAYRLPRQAPGAD